MAFMTPSVRAATLAETIPAVAACPTTTAVAALTVAPTSDAGTQADAASRDKLNATVALGTTMPWRAKRLANIDRARASRLDNVPSGKPSWSATSLRVL